MICTYAKEIEENFLRQIEAPMDMDVDVTQPTSPENMKQMERKLKQTTLFQFVKKSSSVSSVSLILPFVSPVLSKLTFEGSSSFPFHFSNLHLK